MRSKPVWASSVFAVFSPFLHVPYFCGCTLVTLRVYSQGYREIMPLVWERISQPNKNWRIIVKVLPTAPVLTLCFLVILGYFITCASVDVF
jgi:hypothetical protein